MYHTSTQKKFWTFKDDTEVAKARNEANENYRKRYLERNPAVENSDTFFLTTSEEGQLLRWFNERWLKEFCKHFNPPMPINCIGTACQYIKRLYLRFSVMDYNPKLMIFASVWLACKTEEFNISMDQFIWNMSRFLNDEAPKYGEGILSIEMTLIKELNFHLTVHNPFRPFEGFLIDVKTRYPQLKNPEILRKQAKDYLFSSLFSDVTLFFTPSQIALAAMLSAASKQNILMDTYVTDCLLQKQPQSVLDETITKIKKIRSMIKKNPKPPSSEVAKRIEDKLDKCRDKERDPLTTEYEEVKSKADEEKDRISLEKWRQQAEKQRKIEASLLGF